MYIYVNMLFVMFISYVCFVSLVLVSIFISDDDEVGLNGILMMIVWWYSILWSYRTSCPSHDSHYYYYYYYYTYRTISHLHIIMMMSYYSRQQQL
jgi:hypothetical protein